MPKTIISQDDFSSGEISPRLYNRVETTEYKKALQTAVNVTLTPHGPIKRRNGSKFVALVKDSSKAVRLAEYELTSTINFVLEFGDSYIRFFKNGGQIVEAADSISSITQADPAVVTTSSAHGFSNGDQVYITGVEGMTEINNSTIPYQVANVTSTTFKVQTLDGTDVDSSGFTAHTSSTGSVNKIYEISSPWDETEVPNLQYVQRGTVMYIVHPDYAPRTLIRTSDTNWSLDTLELLPPPTYEAGFEPTGTITPAATTGTGINFTASSGIFLDGDVGRQIINNSSGETGRASITSITSSTVAVCDIIEDFTDTNAIANGDWKLDLSPVVDLEIDASQAGAIANIRSEYTSGSLGPRFTITNVTQASPGVVTTSASHGYSDGDKVQIQDIVGMTQINDKIFTVDNVTSTTFELKGENTTGFTAYSSGGIVRKKLDDTAIDAFRSADVGKYILINGGVLQIISVNAADDVDAEILKSLNSTDTSGNWTLEEDTWSSTRGYPRAVGLYEERLVFGGTTQEPQSLWFSETGIFDGFGIGPDDEDAISVELVSNKVNQINWIAASRDLTVGTSSGELTINSGGSSAFTPSTIQQQPRTSHGSDTQQVVKIDNEVLFIQKSERKIRTFRYDFNVDSYTGEDLLYLAEHISEDGVKECAYAQEPDRIIYAVTNVGDLLVGTYDRAKRVIGWSKTTTQGDYENVVTIPSATRDEPWVVVKREINGATKRYIEQVSSGDGVDDIDGFVDSYLTLSNPITISGITNANPAVVTATGHGLSDGDSIIIKDLVDPESSTLDASKTNISDLNQGVYTVANSTTNTFELSGVDTTNYNAYESNGNVFERVSVISNLDHLEGKTVSIRADGAVLPQETVTNGSITADEPAGEFVIGLPYTTTIETLHIDYSIGLGSMLGQRSRWARPLLRVYRSVKPLVNSEFLPARSTADKLDQKVSLFSGFLEYGSLNWDNTSALTITTSEPLPLQLTGITGIIDGGVK